MVPQFIHNLGINMLSVGISAAGAVGAIPDYSRLKGELTTRLDQQTGSNKVRDLVLAGSQRIEGYLREHSPPSLNFLLTAAQGRGIIDVVLLHMVTNAFERLGPLPADSDPLVALANHLLFICRDAIEGAQDLNDSRALLEPVVMQILDVFLPNLGASLPLVSSGARTAVFTAIKDQLLPFLVEWYEPTVSWISPQANPPLHMQNRETKQSLLDLAHWTTRFALDYLKDQYNEFGKTLTKNLWDPVFPPVNGVVDGKRKRIFDFFRSLFFNAFLPDNSLNDMVARGLNRYIASALERIFFNLFSRIDQLEGPIPIRGHKEWFPQRMAYIFGQAASHFERLNQCALHYKAPRVDLVTPYGFSDYFGDHLVDGSLGGFFKPLVLDILEIVNVTKESLPVPDALKDTVWDMLTNNLLPKMFEKMYVQILDPANLDSMLLSLVQKMTASMHVVEEGGDPKPPIHDAIQHRMDAEIGKFLLQFMHTVPGTWAESILAKDSVRADTAAAIGQTLRQHLDIDWSLGEIIRLATVNGIGALQSTGVRDPKVKEQLQAAVVDMLITHTNIMFRSYVVKPWREFQGGLDQLIQGIFGNCGVSIKHCLDSLFDMCLSPIISIIYSIISFPFKQIAYTLLYWHMNKKVAVGIKVIHLPIHRDLLLNITRDLVASLKLPRQV